MQILKHIPYRRPLNNLLTYIFGTSLEYPVLLHIQHETLA